MNEEITTWRLRENLRHVAEEVVKGREAFEKHQLGGRKSSKPLKTIELSPIYVLQLLDELDRLEKLVNDNNDKDKG